MPLRVDSSHQSCLSAPVLEAALERQTTEYSVPTSAECATIHGLCQRPSLYVDIDRFIITGCLDEGFSGFVDLSSYHQFLRFLVADTKRKVEQISEELKTLDEMLAGKDGTDVSLDTSDTEGTSPAPHEDSDQMDGKGTFFLSAWSGFGVFHRWIFTTLPCNLDTLDRYFR